MVFTRNRCRRTRPSYRIRKLTRCVFYCTCVKYIQRSIPEDNITLIYYYGKILNVTTHILLTQCYIRCLIIDLYSFVSSEYEVTYYMSTIWLMHRWDKYESVFRIYKECVFKLSTAIVVGSLQRALRWVLQTNVLLPYFFNYAFVLGRHSSDCSLSAQITLC